MALTENTFSKCAPSISTNIKQCGTVALCNAQPLTSDDLTDAYMKSGEYRVMDALLKADMEIKQCEAQQNGLYDFLMANKVNMSKRIVPQGHTSGLTQIAPFIKARQFSPINNEFWLVSGGSASGGDWAVTVSSPTNIPADIRSFPVGMRVYINSEGEGGAVARTAWTVVSATDNGDDTLDLVLESMNANSFLDDAKIANPVSGYLRRGTNNVSDYESECNEQPAYLNKKLVPFWIQTGRWSFCKSSKYDQYRRLVLENNPLFREFGDVEDIERNRQLADDWQRRWVNQFFFAKALANQTMADYDQLEEIPSFDAGDLGFGVDGNVCVGKRAEATGVIEQLAECGRVVDLLGGQLNMPALFRAFYDIIRVRDSQGNRNRIIDVFTDTQTAEILNQAMLNYYIEKSNDTLRITVPAGDFQMAKRAEFGFLYRSYPLFWPQGVTMNVLTHWAFDDELDVADVAGIPDTARMLWVLDFTGIYPGIVASNRVVHNTGDLKTLAAVNPDFSCVMKVHTRQQTLYSVTWAAVVECPFGNLVIENFSGETPSIEDTGEEYPPTTTTTTTPP